jgi:hypothetical protein
MKTKTVLFTFAATLALGLAGCSKNEPTTPAAGDVNKAVDTAAAAATNAIAEVTNTVAATNTVDASKVPDLIDKAKGLVADGKYSDAAAVLQQLTGQSLTDDQQKLVDSLKDQIQKALAAKAGNAADAAGGLPKQ